MNRRNCMYKFFHLVGLRTDRRSKAALSVIRADRRSPLPFCSKASQRSKFGGYATKRTGMAQLSRVLPEDGRIAVSSSEGREATENLGLEAKSESRGLIAVLVGRQRIGGRPGGLLPGQWCALGRGSGECALLRPVQCNLRHF